MKIIFASNGDIGSALIRGLFDSKHEIVCVYTSRNEKDPQNEVYQFAKERNLKIASPTSFKNDEVKSEFLSINHDIVIVASYGFILPDWFFQSGKYNAINLHPSSLPRFRGAAPVQRSIEAGDKALGLCVIFMTKKLDAGDILAKKEILIKENENALDIFEKIDLISSDLVLKTLDKIDEITPEKQIGEAVYARKIEKNELFLNPREIDAIDAFNKIRAFSRNGYCYIIFNNERIKILTANIRKVDVKDHEIGEIDEKFSIYFKNGIIDPIVVQREGKRSMSISDFLLGWRR